MRSAPLVLVLLAAAGCITAPAPGAEGRGGPPVRTRPPPRPIPAGLDVRALPPCPPQECPPMEMGMPNWQCADGRDWGGPTCRRLPDGVCAIVTVDCPVRQLPPAPPPPPGAPPPTMSDAEWKRLADLPACEWQACPPTGPRMPSWWCVDGRQGGPVCKRGDDGKCGWVVIRCPRMQ